MKRITLIKSSSEIQLAHLYEHLYMMAIVDLFKSHGLCDYLDYWCSGKTYDGGFMYIDVHLYSQEAEKLASELSNLEPDFSQEIIEGAGAQLIAEEQHLLGGDVELVEPELVKLHSQPWQTMNEVTLLDTSHKAEPKVLWNTDVAAPIEHLSCELVLNAEFAHAHKNLLPLFDVVSHILLDNIANELTDSYYYAMTGTEPEYAAKVARRTHNFRGWLEQTPELTDELEMCKALFTHMVENNIVGKIVDFLQNADYQSAASISTMPSELGLYESTGILLGAAGWQELATKEHIISLLQNTKLRLTYGAEKQELLLTDSIHDLAP